MKKGMENWWNDIDTGQSKYMEKDLFQCHFVHHKYHTNWPGDEPRPPREDVGDSPLEPWHGLETRKLT